MKFGRSIIYILAAGLMAACSGGSEIPKPPGGGDDDDKVTVIEYLPAPGQFINEGMTATTREAANQWAQNRLDNKLFVSLGSFGGYIVVKMPEPVSNKAGYDFAVAGNAIDSNSEPGIVWVAQDVNGSPGQWYELKGSDSGATLRNFKVTYYNPGGAGDVYWESEDPDGNQDDGYIYHVPQHHAQTYYPAWIGSDSYTLTGSYLAARTDFIDNEWVNKPFDWGYADNMGSGPDSDAVLSAGYYRYNRFDISNAINSSGNAVALSKIDYIKVQTAVLSNAGITGEVSTEVTEFKVL